GTVGCRFSTRAATALAFIFPERPHPSPLPLFLRERGLRFVLAAVVLLASAGDAEAASLGGAQLSLVWAAPFLGLLISIGLGPLVAERFWHRHYGKIAFLWAAGLALALALRVGVGDAFAAVVEALVADCLPFILMMFALYVT